MVSLVHTRLLSLGTPDTMVHITYSTQIFRCEKGTHFLFRRSWIIFFPCISNTVKVSANSRRQGIQTLRHLVSYIVLQKDLAEETWLLWGFFFADNSAHTVFKSNYPRWYHLTLAVSSENSEVHSVESIGRGREPVPCEVPVRLTLDLSDMQLWRCAYTVVWQSASRFQ